MIVLGGLSMTATQSKRNTAPKGSRDRGKGKTVSSFIFRIIKGPRANYIILEALYTIDLCPAVWVQPCSFMWAVGLEDDHERIGAISLFQVSSDELWNIFKVSGKVDAAGTHFFFHLSVIPVIKHVKVNAQEEGEIFKNKCFLPEKLQAWNLNISSGC